MIIKGKHSVGQWPEKNGIMYVHILASVTAILTL